MLLKGIRYLVTQNEKREILENVDILIEGNKISEIGKNLDAENIIECSDRIVLPGLINCHTHLGMTLLRGVSDDKELAPWLKEVVEAEHKLSKDEISEGVNIGIKEAIRTGTTTLVDMYDPIEPSIESAKILGVRLLAIKGFFNEHEVIPEKIELPEPSETVSVGLGPHSIYGTTEKFLNLIKFHVPKTPIHMHVSETRKERVECKKKLGKLPVEYLDSINFLDGNVTLAHCIWLTKGELDLLAKTNTNVVHCPQANMKLAGGSAMPLKEMQARGINVALGTDSVVSNNSMDMFREMHVAAILHKHHYWDASAASAQKVLDMATVNGAIAIGLNVGSLEKGKLADIISLDLNDLNLTPASKDRIISHLVYSANGMNVSEVIINGKLLLQNKDFAI